MAFTLGFHIILASLGVGFPAIMLIANYRGLRHDDPDALLLARRWSKVVAVTFAVGAVTGTVLSFEFGLLWPEFTEHVRRRLRRPLRHRGDLLLPRGDLRRDLHLRLEAPVAVGALLDRRADRDRGIGGAFSVVAVNSWMNQPQGFTMSGGEVTDVDPLKVIFNPAVPYEVPHMILAAYLVSGLPGGVGVRGRDAARAARPLPPPRPADPADGRARSRRRSSSPSATPPRARSPRTSRSSSPRWSACRRPRRT